MSDFYRVKDKQTGHEYSVRFPDPEQHEVLEKPAVDFNGDALPGKPHLSVAKKATAKHDGGEPAEIPEEGSK